MFKNIFHSKLTQFFMLVSVLPMMIGHGVGCLDCPDPVDPEKFNFVFSGSSNIQTKINVGTSLNIAIASRFSDLFYISPPDAAGTTITPIKITAPNSSAIISSNSASNGNSVGELWVHKNGKSLKLNHNATLNSYLIADYEINKYEFTLPESVTIASSSQYSLSGDATASELISFTTSMTIYLNNVILFSQANDGDIPAILFTAVKGDLLRIVSGGAGYSDFMSAIWLHTPSGKGIKLTHDVISDVERKDVAFFDMTFIVE